MDKKRRIWWCVVCGSDENDEVKYGQLCETKDFNVHFFCLLLSSTFEQRGRDNEGVFGFRVKDIHHGLELIKDTICWYCGHTNASIYCSKKGCRRVFHLTCGVLSGCLSQFLGNFESFCHKHNDEFQYRDYKDDSCVVCRDAMGFCNDGVETDCCKSVFHRGCLGSLALSAGYFFKCPLCANTDQFRRCMREKGIFVPDRDASWELETNAFNDLYVPRYSCEAPVCLSKHKLGREFNSVNGYAFMNCSSCGAGSIHRKCCPTPSYVCDICRGLFAGADADTTVAAVAAVQGDIELTTTTTATTTTHQNNSLSDSVVRSLLMTIPATPEAAPSVRRRSTRHSLQRQLSPQSEAGSPFKLRQRSNGTSVGGTPKRRRLR